MKLRDLLPIVGWAQRYQRVDVRSDLMAGLTVGAMLVPQAMAYALLAGLPPEVGLYAATGPLVIYAIFGTSRQLAVGPVAIVSLLTASALAPVAAEGTAKYLEAAALLALMVGILHLVLAMGRLGFLVNFLSHAVLVGFTAAAALIIGFSQAKHLLGVAVPQSDHFYENVLEVARAVPDTSGATFVLAAACLASLIVLKRFVPRLPGALIVVAGSTAAVRILDLEGHGVRVVGDVPAGLPGLGLPTATASLVGDLAATAVVITLVGFMESIAVAKVYARRHHQEISPNNELVGLGAANLAAGFVGGYPVTGGFSRTAVNDAAGARTPAAAVVTAIVVLLTLAFLTPLFSSLPQAALGAIIVMAVIGLVDVREMRHIAHVKRSDVVAMAVAFGATLLLGIEIGIAAAVVASILVVFARMSVPHTAVLGLIDSTTSYRNVERFPEAAIIDGVRIVRIDAALSFVNAVNVKKLLLTHADAITDTPRVLLIDASGVNDLDATGADMIRELLRECEERDVTVHFATLKGPVRDVLWNAGIWEPLTDRIHTSTHDAVCAITERRCAPPDKRKSGIDEHASAVPQNKRNIR